MNLLSILSKYKPEDAKQMEQESLFSTDSQIGLSPVEQWELEKQTSNKDFFTFHKEMTSQSIELDNENT